MSTNLYWTPIIEPTTALPDELKFILRKAWQWPIDRIVDNHESGYFQGLAHAGVDGAEYVLKLIDKHGSIHLKER